MFSAIRATTTQHTHTRCKWINVQKITTRCNQNIRKAAATRPMARSQIHTQTTGSDAGSRHRHAQTVAYIRLPLFEIICWLFVCFNGNKCWDSIVYDFMSWWVFELACDCVERASVFLCTVCIVYCAFIVPLDAISVSLCFTQNRHLCYKVLCCRRSAVTYSISARFFFFLSFFTRSSQLDYVRWCICYCEYEKPSYFYDMPSLLCTFGTAHGGSKKNQRTKYDFRITIFTEWTHMKSCAWSVRSHGPSWNGESKIYSLLNWIGVASESVLLCSIGHTCRKS